MDRRPVLLARNRIKAAIRGHLEAQGFVEVDTACLQLSPGNETHLHAFATERIGTDLARARRYLATSPEFAMKKLLAAGEQRIFTFAPVFRNREQGPLHTNEFTMLEWYRVGEPLKALWEDCATFLRIASGMTGRRDWSWRGRTCDVLHRFDHTSLDQAFSQFAGIALHETYTASSADRDALAARASARGYATSPGDSWSDVFSKILTEAIEPYLGVHRPEFLDDYPIHEAALARPVPDHPQLAERFELYVCGVELANGFGELNDPVEQRRRLTQQMELKQTLYAERYPIDEDFLAALAHMPDASGCALGFDRLVMLATGASSVADVQWTPAQT